jgi:large subunit ribosomal protein L21
VLDVATIDATPGSRIELHDVLMVTDGSSISVGSPLIAGAMVVAEVLEHGKARKVISFKYKAKTRYRRKRGHRQGFTKIAVREILTDGARAAEAEAAAPTRRSSRTAAVAPEEPATAAVESAVSSEMEPEASATEPEVASVPEAEATPSRRRRRTPTEESTQE